MTTDASRDEHVLPGEGFATGTPPGGSGIETGNWLKRGHSLQVVRDGVGEVEHEILKA